MGSVGLKGIDRRRNLCHCYPTTPPTCCYQSLNEAPYVCHLSDGRLHWTSMGVPLISGWRSFNARPFSPEKRDRHVRILTRACIVVTQENRDTRPPQVDVDSLGRLHAHR